jgi:predicted DsbA family dithiol-disulfide isomerase
MTRSCPNDPSRKGSRMDVVEVFADVACPFTHVGVDRFIKYRQQWNKTEPILRFRAWPLEIVNSVPLAGLSLAPKIKALRCGVAPDLFAGFHETRFPSTSLPAMAAEAAAYRQGLEVGERFSVAVRRALFEDGLDISDEDVLRILRHSQGVPRPSETDRCSVESDFAEGERRGVTGSPHFFTAAGDFFCPSLDIERDHDRFEVTFDPDGFNRFVAAVFASDAER